MNINKKVEMNVKKLEKQKQKEIEKLKNKIEKRKRAHDNLNSLKQNILNIEKITPHCLELLKNDDNFATNPNLALAMFHCCNNDNRMHVFNDETLLDNDSDVFKIIKENIKEPVIPQILKNIFSEIIKESKISK